MNKYGLIFIILLFVSPLVMAEPLMYVPTGNGNDIVIIDLETDKIVGRIDELENVHGLSSSPKSDYLIAGSMKPPESEASPSLTKPAAVSEAEHAAHHAGGDGMPSGSESYLSIVHAKHGRVMRRIAVRATTHHTAMSPDGKIAVAVHSGAGGISVVDLDTMTVMMVIDTGQWPNYAVFNEDGDHLYVSNAGENTVSEIDTQSWKITRELKVGKAPEHIVLGARERMLYTANKGDASVSAFHLASGKVKQTYMVGNKPHGIDVSDDGRWLFVVSKKDERVTRIDLSSGERQTVQLSPAPYHLTYMNNPGMNNSGMNNPGKVYVSSRKKSMIWVLDPVTLMVINSIDLEQGIAHQMVIRDE